MLGIGFKDVRTRQMQKRDLDTHGGVVSVPVNRGVCHADPDRLDLYLRRGDGRLLRRRDRPDRRRAGPSLIEFFSTWLLDDRRN